MTFEKGYISWNKERLAQNFWPHVHKTHSCWLWPKKPKVRYGSMGDGSGRSIQSHHASWIIHFGEIPKGMHVLHTCDNGFCVNPNHLFLGTHEDNMRDAQRKGRLAYGERSGRAKLKTEQVLEIIALSHGGATHAEIARLYGLSQPHVSRVVRGLKWKHLRLSEGNQP